MRWIFSLLCLAVLAVATCEAFLGAAPSPSSSGLLNARGGAVIKKSMATAKASSSSSSGLKRTRVYKKEGFVARFMGGMKSFVKSYFASLITPRLEQELTTSSSMTSSSGSSVGGGGSAAAALKASAARRKRTGGRRTGSISDLAPEPSSCGG